MKNQLQQVFNFNGTQIRTVLINGVIWFIGKDVAKVLGYSNTRKAIQDHVDDEDKKDGVTIRDSIGRNQQAVAINESGVYALIFGSNLPDAKNFKHWVTSEVLPELRKTGTVNIESKDSYLIEDPIERAKQWIKEAEERKRLKVENKKMESKSNYFDNAMHNPALMTMTVIAKEYGLSARLMNEVLHELHVIYKQGETWVMYSEYANKGYAQYDGWNNDKFSKYKNNLKWTQRGKKFIHDLLLEKKNWRPRVQQMSLEVKLNNIRKENSHENY